jgi:hypothetical protein
MMSTKRFMAFPPLWGFHLKKLRGYKPSSSFANIEDRILGVKQGGEFLITIKASSPRRDGI